MPAGRHSFTPAFGTVSHLAGYPPQCADRGLSGTTWAQRSSLQRGCVVPFFIAWRPHPPVWRPPTHFPAALVIESVFGIRGSSCLASTPSGLSLLDSPGLPPSASAGSLVRAPQFFRTSIGHRVEERNPWQLQTSRKSASCGDPFSTACSLALATALLVARLLG
jgi:hypothetical protein